MKLKTHAISAGAISYLGGAGFFGILWCVLGAVFPDTDHHNSLAGKLLPLHKIKSLKHRTYTHSLFLAPFFFMVDFWLGIGFISHVFLDLLTPSGVYFLYPFYEEKVNISYIRVGGDEEFVIYWGVIAILIQIIFVV